MRKFMKFCGAAALIMLAIGLVLVTVVKYTKGTGYMNEFLNEITDGWFHTWAENMEERHTDRGTSYAEAPVNPEESNGEDGTKLMDDILEGGQELMDDITDGYESFEGYQIEDSSIFDKNYPTESGDVEHTIELSAADLSVELGGCSLEILTAEDGICRVSTQNIGKLQVYQKGEELRIRGTRKAKENASQCKICLYLPEGYHWDEVDMELGAGSIYVESMDAGKLDLEVGAGKLDMNMVIADSVEASVGAGEVILNGINVKRLELEVSMGSVSVNGTVSGNIDAECSMGNIDLYLTGFQEEFNYQLECMAGNIELEGQNYGKGITQTQKIDNGADKKIDLECSMGNILVNFEN